MLNGFSPIEADADVECALLAPLYNEQVDDPMLTTPLEDKPTSYGSEAGIMITIARSKILGFIAEKVDCIYSERTRAEVEN